MHEFDDRHEVTRRARETLQRLDDADRRRRFEEQQRGLVDDLGARAQMVADWRGCRTTTEMTSRQFAAWCDAGKPPLKAPVAMVPKTKVDDLVRAGIDRERANTQASFEAFAVILGEEVALIENKLRADFKAELDALRAETSKQHGDAGVLDLPDWRSPHVEH